MYGFFNNHYHGYAPENGLQILEMLGVITPAQAEMKKHIEDFRAGITRVAGGKLQAMTLDSFADASAEIPPLDAGVADALKVFVDSGRLDRAARIPSVEVQVEVDKDEVRAKVKEYTVVVDFAKKTILHDCEDWSSRLVSRKFCKHVAAVFLRMNHQGALEALDKIRGERREWRFDVPSET